MKPWSDKNDVDDLFSKAFENFQPQPSEVSWIKIERTLDKNQERKIIPIKAFKRLSIAASFILVAFAGWYFMYEKKSIITADAPVIKHPLEHISEEKRTSLLKDKPVAALTHSDKIPERTKKSSKQKNNSEHNAPKILIETKEKEALSAMEPLYIKEVSTDHRSLISDLDPITKEKDLTLATNTRATASSSQNNTKKEINNMVDALNFLAEKISGKDEKIVAVESSKALAMSYKVDLGFIKFSRTQY